VIAIGDDDTKVETKKPKTKLGKDERDRYSGHPLRVLGEVDYRGALLVEFMSGPLEGERRWFTEQELKELAGDA